MLWMGFCWSPKQAGEAGESGPRDKTRVLQVQCLERARTKDVPCLTPRTATSALLGAQGRGPSDNLAVNAGHGRLGC